MVPRLPIFCLKTQTAHFFFADQETSWQVLCLKLARDFGLVMTRAGEGTKMTYKRVFWEQVCDSFMLPAQWRGAGVGRASSRGILSSGLALASAKQVEEWWLCRGSKFG